jgi:hypothetical protein
MEKPDVLTNQHSAPTATQWLTRLRRHWDFLAVLLLMAASLPVTWLSPRALIIVAGAGMFDDHCVLDTPFKDWMSMPLVLPLKASLMLERMPERLRLTI